MAWIYLAAWEESPSPWRRGLGPSHIVSKTVLPSPFFFAECMKDFYLSPLFGMTFGPLPPGTCPRSIWSMVASPAKTLVLQELELAWREADRAYFSRSFASLAKFDPDSFSWKTSQLSLFGGLTEFSWSSLRWGTIVDGRLYQPQRWEPRTFESDGSSLPTPRAHETGNYQRDRGQKGKERPTLTGVVRGWATPTARDHKGRNSPKRHGNHSPSLDIQVSELGHEGFLNPHFVEVMMGYAIGWTVLEDWATRWFRPKRAKRSKGSSASRGGSNDN